MTIGTRPPVVNTQQTAALLSSAAFAEPVASLVRALVADLVATREERQTLGRLIGDVSEALDGGAAPMDQLPRLVSWIGQQYAPRSEEMAALRARIAELEAQPAAQATPAPTAPEASGLTNCDTCANDYSTDGWRRCRALETGHAEFDATDTWAGNNCAETANGAPKPNATGCPGFKARE